MRPEDITLDMTCGACPEQYDAFYRGAMVGYLRLRHGWFYAAVLTSDGDIGEHVFEAETEGDGMFAPHERDGFLEQAKAAIAAHYNGDISPTTSTPTNLAAALRERRAIAEAATPGVWESTYRYPTVNHHDWLMTTEDGRQLVFAVQVNLHDNPYAKPRAQDIDHIVANDPATVLLMLAVVEAAREIASNRGYDDMYPELVDALADLEQHLTGGH